MTPNHAFERTAMTYRRTVVVRDARIIWTIVLVLWTILVVVLWFRLGRLAAIAASILLVFPLAGIVVETWPSNSPMQVHNAPSGCLRKRSNKASQPTRSTVGWCPQNTVAAARLSSIRWAA